MDPLDLVVLDIEATNSAAQIVETSLETNQKIGGFNQAPALENLDKRNPGESSGSCGQLLGND